MICICTDKNRLFFFAADVSTQRFIKETDGALKDGINISHNPTQIFWEDNYIYCAQQKNYLVFQKNSNPPSLIHKIEIDAPCESWKKND